MNETLMKGMLVTIYLRGDHSVGGSILELSKDKGLLLKTLDGSKFFIPKISEIVGVKYLVKNNNEVAKEYKVEENLEVSNKPGDIESLTQLRKMKNEEELKKVRKRILKPTPTAEGIEYGTVLSTLRAFKNDSEE